MGRRNGARKVPRKRSMADASTPHRIIKLCQLELDVHTFICGSELNTAYTTRCCMCSGPHAGSSSNMMQGSRTRAPSNHAGVALHAVCSLCVLCQSPCTLTHRVLTDSAPTLFCNQRKHHAPAAPWQNVSTIPAGTCALLLFVPGARVPPQITPAIFHSVSI
jgi:hypothetical protein